MFEQPLRVANLFHIKHNDARRLFGVEGLVQVLQYVFNTQLCAVAHCPNAVELQAIAHAVLLDKHGGGATTRDEVHAFRVEGRDGCVEAASVVHIEEACAVGANQAASDAVDGVDDMLLDSSTFGVLLREASADDDEAFAALLFGQHVNGLGAELGSDTQEGTVHLRQVINLGIAFHALHFGLFGVHGINRALERAFQKVLQGFSTGFVNV